MYQQYQPQQQQMVQPQTYQQRPNPQAMQAQLLLQQLMQGAQQGQQQGSPGSPQGQNTGLNKQPTAQKNMFGMTSLTDEASARSQAATANANKSFSTPGYGF